MKFDKFIKNTIRKESGCLEWTGAIAGSGYPSVHVKGGKYMPGGRFIYESINGPIPNGMFVCHKCDNPLCVEVDHLFLGTPKDNAQDMVSKGRLKIPDNSGENNGMSKLTAELVNHIRTSNKSNTAIAKEVGVTQGCISNIRNYKSWKTI